MLAIQTSTIFGVLHLTYYIGVDIGGTKCAVLLGNERAETLNRVEFATRTDLGPDYALEQIDRGIDSILAYSRRSGIVAASAGISCGGPLDTKRGVILSPPNLPGWDEIAIVDYVHNRAGVRTSLLNDADASALAEYRFGAGRGCRSMVFMTFGTGMGAGLVLDGRLYSGVSGLAGEIGHIRIAEVGPVHYGKAGSFEAFCSGSGIVSLAACMAEERIAPGETVSGGINGDRRTLSAAELAELAEAGDEFALEVFAVSGRYLGRGCAILIDLLNLDRIVIGSVYVRCRRFLESAALDEIDREALEPARAHCTIVPAGLGERIGDVASLCVAMEAAVGS